MQEVCERVWVAGRWQQIGPGFRHWLGASEARPRGVSQKLAKTADRPVPGCTPPHPLSSSPPQRGDGGTHGLIQWCVGFLADQTVQPVTCQSQRFVPEIAHLQHLAQERRERGQQTKRQPRKRANDAASAYDTLDRLSHFHTPLQPMAASMVLASMGMASSRQRR